MDSGANMFVAHQRKYLHRFQRRDISVSLGAGNTGRFTGVGIMVATSEHAPGFLFLCYPTFLAPNDSCRTVSNGAFRKYAGFDRILLDTWRSAQFTHRSGQTSLCPSRLSIPSTTSLSMFTQLPLLHAEMSTPSLSNFRPLHFSLLQSLIRR